MTFPTLFSRIEYGIELAAEKACQIGPFGPVAFGAGKAKDISIVGSTMLLGDDVLNVKDKKSASSSCSRQYSQRRPARSRTKARRAASIIHLGNWREFGGLWT